jgi:hypothetical protein
MMTHCEVCGRDFREPVDVCDHCGHDSSLPDTHASLLSLSDDDGFLELECDPNNESLLYIQAARSEAVGFFRLTRPEAKSLRDKIDAWLHREN